jgi:hypothetical protein
MNRSIPPRDEIWFRKIYSELVQTQKVTTIFRPGKRKEDDPKGFAVGETLRIRIIDKVGVEWAGVFGQVSPDFEMPVTVLSVKSCSIEELARDDFDGATPDVRTPEALVYNLGLLYNLSPRDMNSKSIITRTTFRYL